MALVDATATVSYAHGLRNAYKKDYATKDCVMRHFLLANVSKIKASNADVANVNSKVCKDARTEERFGRAQIASWVQGTLNG